MLYQAPAIPTKATLAQLWMSFEPGNGGTGGAKFCSIWKKKPDRVIPEYK